MFQIEPISTSNLLTILQIIVVAIGFIFSWKTLNSNRKNSQAQLYNQMIVQGRELQFKFSDIYYGPQESKDTPAQKDMFNATLLGYYAACFELRNILDLPETVTKLLDADFRELCKQEHIRRKWDDMRDMFSDEFNSYFMKLRGVR